MEPCILPWINFGTNTFGRPRTCGYSEMKSSRKLKDGTLLDHWNDEYFKEVRREFIKGQWPKNCRRCEYVESLNGTSKRMGENTWYLNDNKHLIAQTAIDGSVPYPPSHLDIRVGTICNLKCIHCGTGASSKWHEDKTMLGKYPNTEDYKIDNKWIEQDSTIWDNIKDSIGFVKRLNFLGGEPFANKQHNKFIKDICSTEHAQNITLSYVTNGLLIDQEILDCLSKFKTVIIRVSVDAPSKAGEYFRFPLKWNKFMDQLNLLDTHASKNNNIDLGLQWTCSNISMFYLTNTYTLMKNSFPDIKFIFCNHVEWPLHMSAQVLPNDVKNAIALEIDKYNWGIDRDVVMFYLNHMFERNLWEEYGHTFLNYLDDLDTSRKIDWKYSLSEMNLSAYDTR